ncbi:MAG: hypothetical protein NPIRA03_37600 [Nitrospirales bacterium]|nr:MAG: hypothetical protein NPIRA03_37600 [Nitrospirales bacterium]
MSGMTRKRESGWREGLSFSTGHLVKIDLTQSLTNEAQKGVLKNAASGVLAPRPCSRTPPYAPLVQAAAALLDRPF